MNGMSHLIFTPQPQINGALWPVLSSRPADGRRLSWHIANVHAKLCSSKMNKSGELQNHENEHTMIITQMLKTPNDITQIT